MKLEDIEKKEVFKVPEEYFDDLPLRIQKRIEAEKPKPVIGLNFNVSFKVLAPVAASLLIVLYFILFSDPSGLKSSNYEAMLDEVSTEELVSFLEVNDFDAEAFIEDFDFSTQDIDISDIEQNWIDDTELDDAMLDELILELDLDV